MRNQSEYSTTSNVAQPSNRFFSGLEKFMNVSEIVFRAVELTLFIAMCATMCSTLSGFALVFATMLLVSALMLLGIKYFENQAQAPEQDTTLAM